MSLKKNLIGLFWISFCLLGKISFGDSSVNIFGVASLDQVYPFNQEDYGTITNGSDLRSAGFVLSSDLSRHRSFLMEIAVSPTSLSLGVLFLNFKDIFEKTDVLVGQVPTPFCLENSNSSKWIPFLERSLVFAFKPCIGPGFSINHYSDNWAFKLATRQPMLGYKITVSDAKDDYAKNHNDAWGGAVRATFIPVRDKKRLMHLGFSLSFQDIQGKTSQNTLSFSSAEVKGRNFPKIVNVTDLEAKNYSVIAAEFSPQWGAFQAESEVLYNSISMRDGTTEGFWGAYAGFNYFLTGQKRTYSVKDGAFSKPERTEVGKYGIWQTGFRYSHVDVTKKSDLLKNTGKSLAVSLNWYPSKKIKIAANYVHSIAENNTEKKHLDSLAVRMQTVF